MRQPRQAVIRWFLVLMGVVATLSPQVALSLRNEDFWAESGIIFYDPEDSRHGGGFRCGPGNTGDLVSGGTIEQQIASFYLGQGFTPEQVAGIIGNAQQESSMWPLALSGGQGNFWGIFQWDIRHGRRGQTLEQRMQDAGFGNIVDNKENFRSPNSAASQLLQANEIAEILNIMLEFSMEERGVWSVQSWQEAVKATNTIEEATEAFLFTFLGAISPAGTSKPDDLIRYWTPMASGTVFYQEARQRREFALAAAGLAAGSCGLLPGGMTREQAQAWLDMTGYNDLTNDIHSRYQLPGFNASIWCGFPGPHGSRANCVGFSTYFIRAWTTLSDVHFGLAQAPGNGGVFVDRLLERAPNVMFGTEPQPYAVFQFSTGAHGHTSIVMGVDPVRQMVVTIEASCIPTGSTGVSQLAQVREFTFAQMARRGNYTIMYAYLMPFVVSMN